MTVPTNDTPLHDYVKRNPSFKSVYDAYRPDTAVVQKIAGAMPEARLVVVAEYWCGDSRRHVPRMARILEGLPGWQVEVFGWDMTRRGAPWLVRAIPTFIVYDGNREVGRIVENPTTGSLESDLLSIVSKA